MSTCLILLVATYKSVIFCTSCICEILKLESKHENFKKKHDVCFSALILYKFLLIPHLKTHLSHFASCLMSTYNITCLELFSSHDLKYLQGNCFVLSFFQTSPSFQRSLFNIALNLLGLSCRLFPCFFAIHGSLD